MGDDISKISSLASNFSHASLDKRLTSFLKDVKEAFETPSEVINENDELLVVYHETATEKDYDKFSKRDVTPNFTSPPISPTFTYFSDFYVGQLHQCHLIFLMYGWFTFLRVAKGHKGALLIALPLLVRVEGQVGIVVSFVAGYFLSDPVRVGKGFILVCQLNFRHDEPFIVP